MNTCEYYDDQRDGSRAFERLVPYKTASGPLSILIVECMIDIRVLWFKRIIIIVKIIIEIVLWQKILVCDNLIVLVIIMQW